VRKILFIECDDCGFAVEFNNLNEVFYYCKEHEFGVNVPNEKLKIKHFCNDCRKEMESYELYEEDNVCPICNSMLNVAYRFI